LVPYVKRAPLFAQCDASRVQQQIHRLVEKQCIHRVARGEGKDTMLYLFFRLVTMLTQVGQFSFCMPLSFRRSNKCCSSEYSRAELTMEVTSIPGYRGLPRARGAIGE